MPALFDGKLEPITFRMGFLESSLTSVLDAFVSWRSRINPELARTDVPGGLVAAAAHLAPFSTPPTRVLFLATDSPWTAYVDNGLRGPDPVGTIGHLATTMACRGVIACCVPSTLTRETGRALGTYGSVQLQLFAPHRTQFLNYERTISATQDGARWRFDATGTEQPFEHPERYSAKRVQDRFPPELLEEYCHALGIRLFDDSFYPGPASLFSLREPAPATPTFSLADARARLGLP